jgi:hypothetical protein
MASLREQIEAYIKRVKDLAEHVKGNEQATKQSLVGPFLTMRGYDLTDPRECIPEYKADFGKDRSTKPIDWAFLHNGTFTFIGVGALLIKNWRNHLDCGRKTGCGTYLDSGLFLALAPLRPPWPFLALDKACSRSLSHF